MTQGKVYRILLWGIGAKYNQMKNTILYYELTHQFKVVGLTAKKMPEFTVLDGYAIVKPYEVSYDYVLILSDVYFYDIMREAKQQYGIPENKFIKYQVLQIPNLNFKDYITLRESGISIISNNCWGGIAYNTLGIECRSPFKNLSIFEHDYIKMLRSLKHYLESVLVFDRYRIDIHSKRSYPVFWLDDIKIHCNHAENIEQAVEDWNRRIKKINFENLFVEMYTESRQTAQEFCDLTAYQKKICFVPFETEGKTDLLQLPILSGQSEFWETVNSNAAIGTNGVIYHLVDLLLYGQVRYRVDSEQKTVVIPVVYATDQNYLFYTCVSITSLAQNAAGNTFYKVYVLTGEGFRDEEKLIGMLNKRYANIQVTLITVDTEMFDHVFIMNEHISQAAFYRLAVCDSIDEDRCIYLDSDTVVTEDLQELWHCEIEAYYLAGCRDVWIDWLTEEECEKRRIATHIPGMEGYVNSGVLVFNLKKIREDRLNESFIAHMNIRYPYEDQDILNVCCYNHILRLPEKWNNFTAGIGYDQELRAAGVGEAVLQVFKTQCGITHYITKDARPWNGRLAWKNWDWWRFAEVWRDTKAYQQVHQYVREKEKFGCYSKLLKKIQSCQTIIIWGYTVYGEELYSWLRKAQLCAKIYFCDSDKDKYMRDYGDMTVLSPEQAFEAASMGIRECFFLISSQRQGEVIREEILSNGIASENILLYRRKDINFYRMLDSRYYEQELDEIFLKEAISILPEQRMQELRKHEEWIDRYYLKLWILKAG